MSIKLNYLFIILILSLFLFADSLKIKTHTNIDMEAETEAKNELKFGMTQDWDNESIAEIQLEDYFTEISDKNNHFLEAPKIEKNVQIVESKERN